ncbi:uncharacterized protein LOC119164140 [Rhipicephalus microplus]|uniref:uncharacterized protein LOC119164140 n=1 Tax=Rhipicephalus microplus TaxID=6941 RepID=UPI003F6A921C
MRGCRTRARKLGQGEDAGSAPPQDLGQIPAALDTTTRRTARLKHSRNKEDGKSDAGVVPEHVIQLCKSVSDIQLISKLKRKGRHHNIDMVTAINRAASELSLPGFPRTDTHEILFHVLPFLGMPQQANETLPSKKEISQAVAFGKATASQPHAREQDSSSVMHTLTSKRKSLCTMTSLPVQDTSVVKVHDAVSGKTVVVTSACNVVVELDKLTPEETASFTSCKHQSSVQNKTVQEHKAGDCCFQETGEPKSLHGQSQGQNSLQSCSKQNTEDFRSGASNTGVPVHRKSPCRSDSSWSDHELSPSLLKPELCQSKQLLPPSPKESCEGTRSERLGVGIENPVKEEFTDQPREKHLLSATTGPEKSSQEQRRVSDDRNVHLQHSPEDTKRHIVRSVSPDALHPPKRQRMRFTTLQEEALVYGVMKYGRGSWKEISEDGWFDGRRTTDLSDKYRNLEKYGHLPKIKRRVCDMLSAGVNPLKKLRALVDQQRLQRANSPVADELLHCKESSASQSKELRGTSPVCDPPDGDSSTASSDEAFAEPLQKRAGTGGAADQQRLQQANSPVADELLHCKESSASQSKGLRRTSPVCRPPDGDSLTTSSDHAFAESLQKQARTGGAVALPKTVCSSPCRPSTSQAHSSAQSQQNSGSETDVPQEVVLAKCKEKRRRVPFTPLEEQALVAGVMKFGKGNWFRIMTEGGFLGRTSIQLSDKYRNLKLYRQLDAIERIVKSKRERGEDPLEELRRLSAAHWKR